jgi:HD-GYP domain-containing protein (c-di-GMP phosphodiesterase class II)
VVLTALSQAIEARDPYTRGYSDRVSAPAEIVARRLGWKNARFGALKLGAVLHDVGKLNVDGAILRKPGPLDEGEYREIKRHPLDGARLIRRLDTLRPALPYILFHHERWDGSGYPSGARASRSRSARESSPSPTRSTR